MCRKRALGKEKIKMMTTGLDTGWSPVEGTCGHDNESWLSLKDEEKFLNNSHEIRNSITFHEEYSFPIDLLEDCVIPVHTQLTSNVS